MCFFFQAFQVLNRTLNFFSKNKKKKSSCILFLTGACLNEGKRNETKEKKKEKRGGKKADKKNIKETRIN